MACCGVAGVKRIVLGRVLPGVVVAVGLLFHLGHGVESPRQANLVLGAGTLGALGLAVWQRRRLASWSAGLPRWRRIAWGVGALLLAGGLFVRPALCAVAPFWRVVEAMVEEDPVDPWGTPWCRIQEDVVLFSFDDEYSAGPNRIDEQRAGDDQNPSTFLFSPLFELALSQAVATTAASAAAAPEAANQGGTSSRPLPGTGTPTSTTR